MKCDYDDLIGAFKGPYRSLKGFLRSINELGRSVKSPHNAIEGKPSKWKKKGLSFDMTGRFFYKDQSIYKQDRFRYILLKPAAATQPGQDRRDGNRREKNI